MTDQQVNYENIFHAILAMDVYHRGPNSGLKNLNDAEITKIGTANLERSSEDLSLNVNERLEQKYGFVAFEYQDSASGTITVTVY